MNPTASFYKLGKDHNNINNNLKKYDSSYILKVKQEINNLKSVVNRDVLMQFADWGFGIESIELMSKSQKDINQDNIDKFLNMFD